MASLEEALGNANVRIAVFLARETETLDPLFEALAQVSPFLPCDHPSLAQRAALQEYRKSLEALNGGLEHLTGRLWVERRAVLAKLQSLKAVRLYEQFAQL